MSHLSSDNPVKTGCSELASNRFFHGLTHKRSNRQNHINIALAIQTCYMELKQNPQAIRDFAALANIRFKWIVIEVFWCQQ